MRLYPDIQLLILVYLHLLVLVVPGLLSLAYEWFQNRNKKIKVHDLRFKKKTGKRADESQAA